MRLGSSYVHVVRAKADALDEAISKAHFELNQVLSLLDLDDFSVLLLTVTSDQKRLGLGE